MQRQTFASSNTIYNLQDQIRKKMSKKDAKGGTAAGAAALAADPAVTLLQQQAAWSLSSSLFSSNIAESADAVKRLTEDNKALRTRLAAQEAKSAETFAHTNSSLEKTTAALKASELNVQELQVRLAKVPLQVKAAADAAKQVMQSEVDELTRKLRDREAALERLADFRKERDDLIAGESGWFVVFAFWCLLIKRGFFFF